LTVKTRRCWHDEADQQVGGNVVEVSGSVQRSQVNGAGRRRELRLTIELQDGHLVPVRLRGRLYTSLRAGDRVRLVDVRTGPGGVLWPRRVVDAYSQRVVAVSPRPAADLAIGLLVALLTGLLVFVLVALLTGPSTPSGVAKPGTGPSLSVLPPVPQASPSPSPNPVIQAFRRPLPRPLGFGGAVAAVVFLVFASSVDPRPPGSRR
jgi:hypothetical protein